MEREINHGIRIQEPFDQTQFSATLRRLPWILQPEPNPMLDRIDKRIEVPRVGHKRRADIQSVQWVVILQYRPNLPAGNSSSTFYSDNVTFPDLKNFPGSIPFSDAR